MLNKRIWKNVLSVLLMLCLCTGMLPAELTFSRPRAAQAEESALPVPAASDAEVLSDGGWLYRVCADGYAEIVGYADVSVTSLSIPASLGGVWVGSLAQNAFADNAALASVTIPSSVAYIPDTAFPNHTALSVRAYNGSAALSFAARRGFECKNTSQYDFFDTILDLSEMRTSQFTVAGSSIVVSAPYARQMREGMKLFFPANGKYTDGLPVKVLSVTQTGTSARITFAALDFMETLETYKVEDVAATPDYENIVILADGFELVPQAQTYGKGSIELEPQIAFKIDHEILEGVKIKGEVSFSPSYELSVEYGWFKIKEFSYTNKSTAKFEGGVEGEFKGEDKGFAPIKFARIPLSSPTLISVWLDTSLEVSASGEIKVVWEMETSESITWNKKGVKTQKNKKTKQFSLDSAVKIAVEAKVAVAVNVGFSNTNMSYDIAEISASVGCEAEVEASNAELGCLDVKKEASFKVQIRIGLLSGSKKKRKLFFEGTPIKITWKIAPSHFEWGEDGIREVPSCTNVTAYTVTFADNYSGDTTSQKEGEGTVLAQPEDPVRSGYVFTGWYTDRECSTPWNFGVDTVTQDVTLYAGWEMDASGDVPEEPPAVVPPETDTELRYSEFGGVVTITGYTGEPPVVLEIPTTIEGYPVKEIRFNAFSNCDTLIRLSAPSVEMIGLSAFDGCDSLTSVNLPAAVTIGNSAFRDCRELTGISLPSAVSVGEDAFNASGLVTVDLPAATSVGEGAFQNCETLTSIYLPAATSIGAYAFESCDVLTSVNLPTAISVGEEAFAYCSFLTNVNLPAATSIESLTFYGCFALTSIDFPAAVSIGTTAFYACPALTNVNLPAATSVGVDAFNSCFALASVNLPVVTSIGDYAFACCGALTSVNVPAAVSIGDYAFYECAVLTSVNLPAAISIGDYAFYGCSAPTSVNLPVATFVGDAAFAHCYALISINLPAATSIGAGAFEGCPGLTSVNLPAATFIGGWAFYDCPALTSVSLPATLDDIGEQIFFDCDSLAYAIVPNLECHAASYMQHNYPDVVLLVPGSTASVVFDARNGNAPSYGYAAVGQPLTRPADPVRMGCAFTGWYRDAACTTPWDFAADAVPQEGVTLYAGWKDAVTSFVFDTAATGAALVDYPGATENLELPADYNNLPVTTLAASAIPSGVKTVHIPATITSIDSQAFRWADDLTAITVDESNPAYRAVDGVLYTKDGTLVSYPRGKTAAAFIPAEGTTEIGDRAIYDCTYLTSLTLPETVAALGEYSVYGCEMLETITFAAEPETIDTGSMLSCADGLRITGPITAPVLCEYADTTYLSYNEYDVIYMENGELLGAVSVRAGELLGQPAQPEEGVMTFKGWSTTEDSETLWDFANGTMPENDLTLHAVWRYDFITETVTNGVKLVSYTGDQTRILVPETVDGQPVVEIAADAFPDKTVTLVGNKGSVTEAYAAAQSMTFEALTYTVAFESNGGTYAAPLTLSATDKVTQPDVLRTGWRLVGWYTDNALTTAWDFANGVMSASDLTLYAGWEKTDANVKEIPFTFDTTEDGLIITGYTGAMGAAEIPETINGVTVIGIADYAFHGDEKLLSVTIPATVETIGESAFNGSRIGSVIMAEGVLSIGEEAFADCTELSSINLPDSITTIGQGAFYGDTALTAVQLPAGLTELNDNVFSGCTFMEEVVLPDDLETIGASAFAECAYLADVILGAKVNSVAQDAFRGCTALTALEVAEGNLYLTDADGVLLSKDGTQLMLYPEGKTDTAYTIPNGVITIADSAMRNSRLQNLTLNEELTVISQNALYGSRYLQGINFAENGQLAVIETGAFGWCASLTELILPDAVTDIADAAFAGCSLESITIPADAFLGENVFTNHSELTIYGKAGSNAEAYAEYYGVRFIDLSTDVPVTGIALAAEEITLKAGQQYGLQAVLTPANNTETALTWYSSNTSIASVDEMGVVSAWYEGEATITVTAANGSAAQCVVTVESTRVQPTELKLSATELNLLPGVMLPLQAIQLPDDCVVLPVTWTTSDSDVAQYLNGCIITIRDGTAVITATASNGLTASCTVEVGEPEIEWIEFFLPRGLQEIGDSAFRGAIMTSVYCSDGLMKIGAYAFADCPNLMQIVIPASVTAIDDSAFEGCDYVFILGDEGSAAEEFAEKHDNIEFFPR